MRRRQRKESQVVATAELARPGNRHELLMELDGPGQRQGKAALVPATFKELLMDK